MGWGEILPPHLGAREVRPRYEDDEPQVPSNAPDVAEQAATERVKNPIWLMGEINYKSVNIKLADYTVDSGLNQLTILTCLRCKRTVTARNGPIRADAIFSDMASHESAGNH